MFKLLVAAAVAALVKVVGDVELLYLLHLYEMQLAQSNEHILYCK